MHYENGTNLNDTHFGLVKIGPEPVWKLSEMLKMWKVNDKRTTTTDKVRLVKLIKAKINHENEHIVINMYNEPFLEIKYFLRGLCDSSKFIAHIKGLVMCKFGHPEL